jgi:hypothetical protein
MIRRLHPPTWVRDASSRRFEFTPGRRLYPTDLAPVDRLNGDYFPTLQPTGLFH